MSLEFPNEWRFDEGLGQMPQEAINDLVELVGRIATQADDQQRVYEIFKARFGDTGRSSDASWAQSDMAGLMARGDRNLPEFIDAYWTAMSDAGKLVVVPSCGRINAILHRHGVGYAIRPPKLVREVVTRTVAERANTSGQPPTYLIGERLGGGAFGEVFQATRESPFGSFEFAIKFLRPSAFTDQDKARQRFEREVLALRKMQHRAIVPYVDAGIDSNGRPFLVMQRIDGSTIRDAISGVDPGVAVTHLLEVLGAVAYAHDSRVLHRDLKPSNILVRHSDGQPIVVDFGLAYMFDDATQETLTTSGLGTPAYMPHEVLVNPTQRDPGHDIYSCGVILYEVIARHLPNPAQYQALAGVDARLSSLDGIIKRALAPVGQRFASAREFRDAIMLAYPRGVGPRR